MRLIRIFLLLRGSTPPMHAHVHSNSGAGSAPTDRAGLAPSPSGGSSWRRLLLRPGLKGVKATAFKPLTYSMIHLTVAISVAYVLTRDWRIALGVGVIEPMVQTVAYMPVSYTPLTLPTNREV